MVIPSSKVMDLRGFSSSPAFREDAPFAAEREVELWKPDAMPDQHAIGKGFASSTLEKHVTMEFQSQKSLEHPRSVSVHEQKMSSSLNTHAMGVERAVDQSLTLTGPINHASGIKSTLNKQISSFFAANDPVNMMATPYENSLFSSSLSELINRKLKISSNSVLYGHSLAANFEEEASFEFLAEIEAQTIGNLLPSDDDLFTGVTDGLDDANQPSGEDGVEELDFFSSIGGMDLGDDGCTSQIDSRLPGGVSNGQLGVCSAPITGEHPYGEHPSRKLFVRNINSGVEDSELRDLFKQYGDIRGLYTACKHRGFVIIYYFDIRAASNAMKELQNRPLRHKKLDIHYSIPKDNPSEEDSDLDTLVVLDLDPTVSNDELLRTFGVYGEVREICEKGSHHKLIEFFDIRAAKAAFQALNRSDIGGKQVKLELNQHCSRSRFLQQIRPELEQDKCGLYLQQSSPPHNSFTGFSAGRQTGIAELGNPQDQLKIDVQGTPNFCHHTFPEYHDGLNDDVQQYAAGTMGASINFNPTGRINNGQLPRVCRNGHPIEFSDGFLGSAGNGSFFLPGRHYTWSNSYHSPPGMIWSNSPSFVSGISVAHPTTQLQGLPRAPPAMLNPVFPANNHHRVGSAPTVVPSLLDRRRAYAGESLETSGFYPGSVDSMGISNNSLHSVDFVSGNKFPHFGGNCIELHLSPDVMGLQPHHQRSMMFPGHGQMIPMGKTFNCPIEQPRSRRNGGTINQAEKKQYELDIDRITQGGDSRTTLMIKNIPNKYTSKMLLAAIDECHKGTYDFIYLPIDFKNKCNVGYAFINMIDPSHIIPFYQTFNGKKWEKFNSEKVASLAYARIQGQAALIAHFQNSSLMNEDKQCRPILFNTDGPNAGDQVPFPVGFNLRNRHRKQWTKTQEDGPQGSSPNLANRDDSSYVENS